MATSTLERPDGAPAPTGGPAGLLRPGAPRSPWRRKLAGAAVAVVTAASVVAVPLSLGYLPSVYQPPLPDGAAFAVGDRVVSVAEYEERLSSIEALYGAQQPTDPAGADRFRRDSAKAIVTTMVLEDAQAERGIVVPDPEVRQALDGMVSAQFGPGREGYDAFVQSLAQVGTSEAAVMNEVRQQYASADLIAQVTDPVQVSNDELAAEFPRFADALGTPELRGVSNIIVPTPEQAQDVLEQVQSGIPFPDLARQVSMDPQTRDAGGALGEAVPAEALQPGYAEAAFAAAPNVPFGPVQTAQGWNVGLVTEVVPGQPAEMGDVMLDLKTVVTNERKMEAWRLWLEEELAGANIRYADEYLPADPTGAPPGLGGSIPAAGQPGAPQPVVPPEQPGAAAPGAPAPGASLPGAPQPGVPQPGVSQPGAPAPAAPAPPR